MRYKNNFKLSFILLAVAFLTLIVSALNFDTFNNGFSSENLTIDAGSGAERNLTIFNGSTFTEATLNLTGFLSSQDYFGTLVGTEFNLSTDILRVRDDNFTTLFSDCGPAVCFNSGESPALNTSEGVYDVTVRVNSSCDVSGSTTISFSSCVSDFSTCSVKTTETITNNASMVEITKEIATTALQPKIYISGNGGLNTECYINFDIGFLNATYPIEPIVNLSNDTIWFLEDIRLEENIARLFRFNDSLETKNFSFSTNENITAHIRIPKYANILEGFIDLDLISGVVDTGESFNTSDAGSFTSNGITNDGTFFWITDTAEDKVFKFWINGTYTGEFIDVGILGLGQPTGVANNGTFMWVSDNGDNGVYKFWINGTYTGEFFDTSANGQDNLIGLTLNNTFIWISDAGDNGIYKYWMNMTYTGEFFDTSSAGATFPNGVELDGEFILIVDPQDETIYKFWINGTYTNVNFNLSFIEELSLFRGLSENLGNFWVVEASNNRVVKLIFSEGAENESLIINGTKVWGGGSGVNSTAVNGVQAHYTLDDIGNATDTLGTFDGLNVQPITTEGNGILNNSFFFDGTEGIGSYVDLAPLNFTATNITLSMWINYTNDAQASMRLFSTQTGRLDYYLECDVGDGICLFDGVATRAFDGTRPSPNEWHHLVFVADGSSSTMFLYIDGVLNSSTTFTPRNFGGAVAMGSRFNGEDSYEGFMDDVTIVNRSWTLTEIQEVYNSGTGRTYPFATSSGSSDNRTEDLATTINTFLGLCDEDSKGYCTAETIFHSDTPVAIQASNLSIKFNNISKSIDFSKHINSLVSDDCLGGFIDGFDCTLPFNFTSVSGASIKYSTFETSLNSTPIINDSLPDNDTFSLQSKDLSCSIVDGGSLDNVTFDIYYSNQTLFNSTSISLSSPQVIQNVTINFPETGNYLWSCRAVNNESFSAEISNQTLKVRSLTIEPQTWTFQSPRINEETKWSNSLVVTNPVDFNVSQQFNITADSVALGPSIYINYSNGTSIPFDFNTTDGVVTFNATVKSNGNTFFNIKYNTSNITLNSTNETLIILGAEFIFYNITVEANSTRHILDTQAFFNFQDTTLVEINFYKCNETNNCNEEITNRSDVVFSDNDGDGTSDRVSWAVQNLSNQSYQLKTKVGFPVQISQDIEILNEPVRPFDNVEWRNTITFFNPNSFDTESVLKLELPFGAREIELDNIPKNLQFDPFGLLSPYVLIIDKDDPTHKETLFLLPGQTKQMVIEYITDSVTILSEIEQPNFFKVNDIGEINQILRIKNQADDTVTNIDHNIPITFAEDLRACLGEFSNGCPESGDSDDDLIFDEKSTVNGNYKLHIDSINASEVKLITLSYNIPTVNVINEEEGKSSVVGFDRPLSFSRYTYESKAPFKLADVRHTPEGLKIEEVIEARLCDVNNFCNETIPVNNGTIELGFFAVADRKVVEFWYIESEPTSMGMGFLSAFLDYGKEYDITDSPIRFFVGFASSQVNDRKVITTGRIILVLLGYALVIALAILMIRLISRRKK